MWLQSDGGHSICDESAVFAVQTSFAPLCLCYYRQGCSCVTLSPAFFVQSELYKRRFLEEIITFWLSEEKLVLLVLKEMNYLRLLCVVCWWSVDSLWLIMLVFRIISVIKCVFVFVLSLKCLISLLHRGVWYMDISLSLLLISFFFCVSSGLFCLCWGLFW